MVTKFLRTPKVITLNAKIDAAHSGGQNIKARAFWRMDTHVVVGKKVSKGEFNVKEVWASSCTARPVELFGFAFARTDSGSASVSFNGMR